MILTKYLIITLLVCSYFSNAFSQSRKFPSPASADAIINPLKGNAEATLEGKKFIPSIVLPAMAVKEKGTELQHRVCPNPLQIILQTLFKNKQTALFSGLLLRAITLCLLIKPLLQKRKDGRL